MHFDHLQSQYARAKASRQRDLNIINTVNTSAREAIADYKRLVNSDIPMKRHHRRLTSKEPNKAPAVGPRVRKKARDMGEKSIQ